MISHLTLADVMVVVFALTITWWALGPAVLLFAAMLKDAIRNIKGDDNHVIACRWRR
jgi:hypothetical protein